MTGVDRRNVLRGGAVLDVVLAAFLSSGTWDRLYTALDLPPPRPVIYAQLAGAALLAFAYVSWSAATDAFGARRFAGAAAALHLAAAVLLLAWRGFTDFDVGGLGTAVLSAVALALVLVAALQARVARAA